jgi:hypothetical protein
MQRDEALLSTAPVESAVDGQAGFAKRPGNRIANIQADRVLPTDPIQYSPVRIQ